MVPRWKTLLRGWTHTKIEAGSVEPRVGDSDFSEMLNPRFFSSRSVLKGVDG